MSTEPAVRTLTRLKCFADIFERPAVLTAQHAIRELP